MSKTLFLTTTIALSLSLLYLHQQSNTDNNINKKKKNTMSLAQLTATNNNTNGNNNDHSKDEIDADIVCEIKQAQLYLHQNQTKKLITTADVTILVSVLEVPGAVNNNISSTSISTTVSSSNALVSAAEVGGSAAAATASSSSSSSVGATNQNKNAPQEVYLLIMDNFQTPIHRQLVVIRTAPGQYTFPGADETRVLVLPSSVEPDAIEVLESVFGEYANYRVAPAVKNIMELPDAPDKLALLGMSSSALIRAASAKVAQGIMMGAKYLGQGIHKASDFIISRSAPAAASAPAVSAVAPNASGAAATAASSSSAVVAADSVHSKVTSILTAPTTKARLQQAKFASGAAVKVSKALVVGASAMISQLANNLSETLASTEQGRSIQKASGPRAQALKELAKSSISAAATLYEAVSDASVSLLHDITDATGKIIEHKYGQEAGASARDGLQVIKDAGIATVEMRKIAVTALAGRTVATATVDLLSDEQERQQRRQAEESQKQQVDPMLSLGISMLAANANVSAASVASASSSVAVAKPAPAPQPAPLRSAPAPAAAAHVEELD